MLDTELTNQTSSCDDVEVQANFVTGCLFCELPEEKFEVIEENDL
jgi:hypothetical protein